MLKRIKVVGVFFSLVLLLFTGSSVADIWINTDGKVTNVEIPQINVALENSGMAIFISEDVQYLSRSGEPQIPWKLITVMLPPNADLTTVSCYIESVEYATIGDLWNVSPVPPIMTRDQDNNEIVIWPEDKTIVDGHDTDIYSTDALWPFEDVQLTGTGKLHKWRLAEIAVPLVLYNPISGELQQLVHADITVDYDRKGKGNTAKSKGNSGKGRKFGRIKKLAVNFDDVVSLYEASEGGEKSELQALPSNNEDVIPLSSGGSSGYVIITTNDIRANSTKLTDFVTHKENMGFTVTVIDEDDTGATETGDAAATKLREWLQANYSSMDLKYALIIGDPQPDNGYVPMKLYPCGGRDIPTDYFYAELTCDWDSNGNGIIGETEVPGSYEIERYFEVYVGRIPHYGVMADTDAILQKTIDYETAADTSWRRNALISAVPMDPKTHWYNWGEQVKADILEPNAISSDRVYKDGYGYTVTDYDINPPPEFPASAYPATVWSQGQYGLHIWGTHGWSQGAQDIIESTDTPHLNDNYPSTTFQGSCETASPYQNNNLTYMILKNGGIVTNGATRNAYYLYAETDFSNSPTITGMGYRYAKGIAEHKSCGEALWDMKEEISAFWTHNWTLFNAYGDPSVVVMPTDEAEDTTPPTPDPLTFATAPYATGSTSIAMVATTASDPGGVEYFFTCIGGGGNDSGWQSSASYEDTGLLPDTLYIYTVKARDLSTNQNETTIRFGGTATTDPLQDTTPPTPDPLTFATAPYATGSTSIAMVATTASDLGGVEYFFTCIAGGGNDSGWQDSATYEDTGLTSSTQYTYTVTARDKSASQNTTAASREVSANTEPETNQPPTAGFRLITKDLMVYAYDTSTDDDGSVVAWSWDFGDNNSFTAQNRSHRYSSPGTYSVILTVTDDDGATGSITKSVTVTEPDPPEIICSGNMSQADWTIFWFDSEETQYEDGAAVNAFDGNRDTFWHSQWGAKNAPLPHAISVKWSNPQMIGGIRYLPRQDGNSNGNISDYKVWAYNSSGWKLVAAGTFVDDSSEKTVTFEPVIAERVWLYAYGEAGNSGPWTSMAELNVIPCQ